MLINLSNHPSNNWSKLQFNTAVNNYGQIKDINFPQIDPETAEIEIIELTDKYLGVCLSELNKYPNENNAVHLMGEHTFCFTLANKLMANSIDVVASTTKRNSKNLSEGKLSKFEFVKFRKFSKSI